MNYHENENNAFIKGWFFIGFHVFMQKISELFEIFSMKKSLLGSTCLQTKKLVQQEVRGSS